MDILKKEMAPITDAAWEEIIDQAEEVLSSNLTARKFVDVEGPFGLDYAALSTGRLTLPKSQEYDALHYGIREVMPLVEIRAPFDLDIWELDNMNRGAKDVDLESLEFVAKKVALFEERMIYQGLKTAGIKGIEQTSDHKVTPLAGNLDDIPKLVGSQANKMRLDGVEGPYTLVLSNALWLELINQTGGYPLIKQLKEDILGGNVIVQYITDKSYLISERGGDYELTIGQDTAIGYNSHDAKKVSLFFSASFTYRTLSPEAVCVFTAKG